METASWSKKTPVSWDVNKRVCFHYKTKHKQYNKLDQLDPWVCGDSGFVYQKYYGKYTRDKKMPNLIVVIIY